MCARRTRNTGYLTPNNQILDTGGRSGLIGVRSCLYYNERHCEYWITWRTRLRNEAPLLQKMKSRQFGPEEPQNEAQRGTGITDTTLPDAILRLLNLALVLFL